MSETTTQLRHVANRARQMLWVQLVCIVVTAALVALVLAGVLDFVLRLPGPLRLVLGAAAIVAGGYALLREWRAVARFHPSPAQLALRCERLDPRFAGRLASAVEFAEHHPAGVSSHVETANATSAFAQLTQAHVRDLLATRPLPRLLDATRTWRLATVAVATVIVCSALGAAAGDGAGIAVKRWLLPLGETQWPRRVHVVDLGTQAVWPSDAPLRFRAAVTRGARPSLRAWLWYRPIVEGRRGAWQRQLMVRQDMEVEGAPSATYEAMVPATVLTSGLSDGFRAGFSEEKPPEHDDMKYRVEYRMEAGDDATKPRHLTVAQRPRLVDFTARISPPAYAAEAVPAIEARTITWNGLEAVAHEALIGSDIELTVRASRPLAPHEPIVADLLPGLAKEPGPVTVKHEGATVTASLPLASDLATVVRWRDELGLTDQTDALFQVRAMKDRLPTVALDSPRDEDLMVTPRATVTLVGQAHDDVAVDAIALRVQRPTRTGAPQPVATRAPSQSDTRSETTVTLAVDDKPSRRKTLTAELDLAAYAAGAEDGEGMAAPLRPGEQLLLFAEARDVFSLGGEEHPWVRSPVRVLQVVEPAVLAAHIRRNLAAMRRAAIQLQEHQRTLIRNLEQNPQKEKQKEKKREEKEEQGEAGAPPGRDAAQHAAQRRLAAQVRHKGEQVEALRQQMARNRLDEPLLANVLDQARTLLDEASDAAQRGASAAVAPERLAARAEAADKLAELAALLDQGSDVLALQSELAALQRQQREIMKRSAELQPRTLGLDAQTLARQDPETAAALDALTQQQAEAATEANRVVDRLHAAAEALARQGGASADQAAAAALADAAATARREGLAMSMQQAATRMRDNRLAGAAQQQQQAGRTIQRMLETLGRQEQRRQEILARLLDDLAQAVQRLISQQKASLARVPEAITLGELAPPLELLRRNTLAVGQQAAVEMPEAGEHLAVAGADQAQAVHALREDDRANATSRQVAALEALMRAAEVLDQQRRDAQAMQGEQQRRELAARYAELASRQLMLRDRTDEQLATHQTPERTRAHRRALLELSREELTLRDEAQTLREEVDDAPLFEHLHQEVDRWAVEVAGQLRSGQASSLVVDQQRLIAGALSAMADALEQSPHGPYERPLTAEKAGGGGTGGGNSGGGGAGPQADPARLLAELKLLRHLQQQVYDQAKSTSTSAGNLSAADGANVFTTADLARQQEQVARWGAALAQRLAAAQEQTQEQTQAPERERHQ